MGKPSHYGKIAEDYRAWELCSVLRRWGQAKTDQERWQCEKEANELVDRLVLSVGPMLFVVDGVCFLVRRWNCSGLRIDRLVPQILE